MPVPAALRSPRLVRAAGVTVAAVAVVVLLSLVSPVLPNPFILHAIAFWAVTSSAYLLLPFVRRGDVMMGGMWLVLVAGVGPCAVGQEISAARMFADMAGVLMAAGPIYVARLRQIAQGDLRETPRRRQTETEAAAAAQYSSR